MKLAFWISLAVILYTYLGYPVLIATFARFRPRPWQRAPWPLATHPAPISIVMAVHNAAAMLSSQTPNQIDHLLGLDPFLVREVIIVSDGSTDATNAILESAAGAPCLDSETWVPPISPSPSPSPRLRTLILPQQAGKSAAVNHGVALATGEILLFVDIRPRIEPNALASLLQNFADPSVGCVAGELLLGTDGHDATASAVSGLYWRYEQFLRTCEAAVDSPVGVYGGFYAIRRALAVAAPPGLILDDMFQPLAIIRQGFRSVLDRHALVSDRWPAHATGEFHRKVRTLAGNFQLLQLAPWVLSPANRVLFELISHKLLRLAVPWFFALLLLSSAVLGLSSAPYAAFALLQLLFWTIAAAALKRPVPPVVRPVPPVLRSIALVQRLAAPASALLVLNAAAVAGLYTWLFTPGPLWRIWSPTAPPPIPPAPPPARSPDAHRPEGSS